MSDRDFIMNKLEDEAKVHIYELELIISQIQNNVDDYDEASLDSLVKSLGYAKHCFSEFFSR